MSFTFNHIVEITTAIIAVVPLRIDNIFELDSSEAYAKREKGNAVFKLESLSRMNGFDSSDAHSALFDANLTMKILGLVRKKQPNTWDTFLKTANRSDTETIFKKQNIYI